MLKRLFILAFIGFFGWAQAQTVSSSPWMVLTNGHYFNGVEMLPFDHIVIKDDKIYSIDGEIPRMSTPTIDCNGKICDSGIGGCACSSHGNPPPETVRLALFKI